MEDYFVILGQFNAKRRMNSTHHMEFTPVSPICSRFLTAALSQLRTPECPQQVCQCAYSGLLRQRR